MNDSLLDKIKDFRFERKFCLDRFRPADFESLIKLHPDRFREIYHTRRVNNVYLDSHDFRSFSENINGISQRLKFRIRWYGETFGPVSQPALEIKYKHNHRVGKISLPFKDFLMDENFGRPRMVSAVRDSLLPPDIKRHVSDRTAVLLNSYTRKYFLCARGKFRVTVDSMLCSYRLTATSNPFCFKHEDKISTIVELKYDQDDARAEKFSQSLPLRTSRNSKYVTGLKSLYSVI